MPRKDKDFATGKPVDLTKPEEQVRQEYERVLVESYGYLKSDIDIEVRIPRGSGFYSDKADVVVYGPSGERDPAKDILGIVETKSKKQTRRVGLAQLKSYMTATSAVWGVWTNGDDIAYLRRKGTQVLENYLNNIPARGQSVEDVGRITKDSLRPFDRGELKAAFRRILRTLYANTSISRREKLGSEMIKIIFSKLEDEKTYADSPPEFRAEAGEDSERVALRIQELFIRVREDLKHDGIFTPHEQITLDSSSVAWVVGQLERGSLLKTDSDVVGDAFEVFSESKLVGEKGEFFTPRGIVRIAVKLTNPAPGDLICDPACGSGGFLIFAMKHVWSEMEDDPRWRGAPDLQDQKKRMAAHTIFGIDKETDLVKIAKAHMAIAGDGRSNIVHENSLHNASDFEGDAQTHFVDNNEFRRFDIVLTNPPFGTKAKVLASDASYFGLGHKWKKVAGIWEQQGEVIDRDPYLLFVERCLNMLKGEGILAIVLPETVFHAPSLGYLRQFLLTNNSIIAVIDLPHNTFRPHCNAKTCLLVLRKGAIQQENIIFAVPEEMGHDHQGRALFRPETDQLWDDLAVVYNELDEPDNPRNELTFTVPWASVNTDILVPRFYRGLMNPIELPADRIGISLMQLIDSGIISAWDGHGSPEAIFKGRGSVPYIRVSDIVNWELYRNPVTGIPEKEYQRILSNKPKPEEGDVIFVRRGSYRIGTVAMASKRDRNVLLTRELLTLRVFPHENEFGLTPFYLLAMLSSSIVQQQIRHFVFTDTTLPNIGDRWKYLILPFHKNRNEVERASVETERIIRKKWCAQEHIDVLSDELGGLIT